MQMIDILFVLCLAYSFSALVRFALSANKLSLEKKQREEEESKRKRKIDTLYGRGD
tara:strand:- start:316 stop:483 length:168 start_codon:yes stop_codon:yes gene_type:complete